MDVMADIGDMQSVSGDFSTFSGHLVVCREMMRHARALASSPIYIPTNNDNNYNQIDEHNDDKNDGDDSNNSSNEQVHNRGRTLVLLDESLLASSSISND